jgi:hypothetical protein
MSLDNYQWTRLLNSIHEQKCTPFVGAGASGEWLPLARKIACKWAKEYGYPLEDSDDLARVAQFLAIENGDELYPKQLLSNELKEIEPPPFSIEKYRNTPHAVLADLNLLLYITTNYDYFMEAALESRGKKPVSEFCRWNNYAKAAGIPSVFDKGKKNEDYKELKYGPTRKPYRASVSEPLVYHLHGVIDIPQSIVLTQSDYIDFIVNLSRDNSVLPSIVTQRLASTSLLFVGYSLQDINFSIIFRGIRNLLGSSLLAPNVAVMRLPSYLSDDKRVPGQKYLNAYAKNMFKVDVYWGDASMFSGEIRRHWNDFQSKRSR